MRFKFLRYLLSKIRENWVVVWFYMSVIIGLILVILGFGYSLYNDNNDIDAILVIIGIVIIFNQIIIVKLLNLISESIDDYNKWKKEQEVK